VGDCGFMVAVTDDERLFHCLGLGATPCPRGDCPATARINFYNYIRLKVDRVAGVVPADKVANPDGVTAYHFRDGRDVVAARAVIRGAVNDDWSRSLDAEGGLPFATLVIWDVPHRGALALVCRRVFHGE